MNPIIHPSSMYRKNIVMKVGGYNELTPYNQDYDLWSRVCQANNICNMPDVLMLYRIHSKQTGFTLDGREIYLANIKIMKKYLDQLCMEYDGRALSLHYTICTIKYSSFINKYKLSVLYDMEKWLMMIIFSNHKYKVFDRDSLMSNVSLKWANICLSFSFYGFDVWRAYKDSDLYLNNNKWNDYNIYAHSILKLGFSYRSKFHYFINNY
jgi:hypothetical protein